MVMKKPASIEAIAARSVNPAQNSERIIMGQKVAAMPDQPKMANQNIVLSGELIATVTAMSSATSASPSVISRNNRAA